VTTTPCASIASRRGTLRRSTRSVLALSLLYEAPISRGDLEQGPDRVCSEQFGRLDGEVASAIRVYTAVVTVHNAAIPFVTPRE